ncbi:MAG: hypothetical protein IPM29_25095 [Planctomycetes bacterium]|nr:hypothetical protein [Planctomycetota bacterium]
MSTQYDRNPTRIPLVCGLGSITLALLSPGELLRAQAQPGQTVLSVRVPTATTPVGEMYIADHETRTATRLTLS